MAPFFTATDSNWKQRRASVQLVCAKSEHSSAAVEGLNNKIRELSRRSNGFPTYKAMEIAFYHSLDGFLNRNPPTIFAHSCPRQHFCELNC
jgi:hypothetical protein